MNAQELAAALRAGKRVYGSLVVSHSPRWPDSVAKIGLDFVFIDTEHIALDRSVLSWMCQTYAALSLAPIVRIPAPDPYLASMALDGGAAGVMAPYVETVEQVKALVGAVKLRPLKGRRLQESLEDRAKLEPKLSKYLTANNCGSLLVLNIESRPAMERLEELLAVEGVDATLIGPHDLSCSLGIPEEYDDPRFEEAVLTIIRKSRAAGVAAGMYGYMGIQRELVWAREGMNMVLHSGDIIAMQGTLASEVAALRRELGDEPVSVGAAVDII